MKGQEERERAGEERMRDGQGEEILKEAQWRNTEGGAGGEAEAGGKEWRETQGGAGEKGEGAT